MTTVSRVPRPVATESLTYSSVGVDTDDAEAGLERLIARIKTTWPDSGIGHVKLDVGFFANVIDLVPVWLAITTDGVGTKALVAQMAGRYDTIGIDCVAMNVNDVICVGARPISLVDYLAVQEAAPDLIEQISIGRRGRQGRGRLDYGGGDRSDSGNAGACGIRSRLRSGGHSGRDRRAREARCR